jgi:choloylglycine hydrolase
MKLTKKVRLATGILLVVSMALTPVANACTGIRIVAKDGAVVYGRTLKWGAFDLKSRMVVFPQGYLFNAKTPDGKPGISCKARYGFVGIDGLEKDLICDGMNEKGLAVGVFYHPGFAEYQQYDPQQASQSMGPTDLSAYILTQFSTIKEVREGMTKVRVVPVVEKALGFPAPIHINVIEPSGKAIVIEFTKSEVVIHENDLGVITNSPNFDWHITNLRNYINLSPVALPGKKIENLDFKPLGAGTGMIGLPGDFTPPSRFVRAVAFSKTARPTDSGGEAMYEVFRILDSFNVPLGAAEGADLEAGPQVGLRSSTCWTSAADTKNLVYYFHTQHNRRVRKIDLSKIDFDSVKTAIRFPLDKEHTQDIEDRTPTQ